MISRLPGMHQSGGRPWLPPGPDPAVARAIEHVIGDFQPEIVHGHDWLARSFLPARRSMGQGAFVTTLHYYTRSCAIKSLMLGDLACNGPAPAKCVRCSAAHYGRFRGPAIAATNAVFARSESRASDATIAVSRATAVGNGVDPDAADTFIVPNMIDPAMDHDVELPPDLPAQPFMLYVGDLRIAKGFPVLCRAYERTLNPPPLVVIGARTPDYPGQLPHGMIELGELPNGVVRAIWQRCLFGIIPSIWAEPFGIVVLECMTAGKPVIASRAGGIPEIVTDDKDGLLVAPGDEQALSAAMADLLVDTERLERLGQAARITAANYAPNVVVPQIETVYEWAVARRQS
jgi:glycosyltransferase involved in cell wall biosynthesis